MAVLWFAVLASGMGVAMSLQLGVGHIVSQHQTQDPEEFTCGDGCTCPTSLDSWPSQTGGMKCPMYCPGRNGEPIVDKDSNWSPRAGKPKYFHPPKEYTDVVEDTDKGQISTFHGLEFTAQQIKTLTCPQECDVNDPNTGEAILVWESTGSCPIVCGSELSWSGSCESLPQVDPVSLQTTEYNSPVYTGETQDCGGDVGIREKGTCPVVCNDDQGAVIHDPHNPSEPLLAWPLPGQTTAFALDNQCPWRCADGTIHWPLNAIPDTMSADTVCPVYCHDRNGKNIIDNDQTYSPRLGLPKLFYVPEEGRGKSRVEQKKMACPDCTGDIQDDTLASKFC